MAMELIPKAGLGLGYDGPNTLWCLQPDHVAMLPAVQSRFLKEVGNLLLFFEISIQQDPPTDVSTGKWTGDGAFTTKSAYMVMHDCSVINIFHGPLFKAKVPNRIKIFAWILLQDRLPMQMNMLNKGWPAGQSCTMCTTMNLESNDHLFVMCPFTRRFWIILLSLFNIVVTAPATVQDMWWHTRLRLSSDVRTTWDSVWFTGCWTIWNARNRRIFSDEETPVPALLEEAETVARRWLWYC